MAASLPPFIPVPAIANLRDIGGLPIPATASAPARTVRRGLVYRAADTTKTDAAGVARLRALGLGTLFDLRAAPEIEKHGGVAEFEGLLTDDGVVRREWTPVFAEEDYGPETIALRFKNYAFNGTEGFAIAYSAILQHGRLAFRRILTHLAQPDARSILVHCSAGKDRTGVFCAVLLSALGVPDEQVAEEYALTEVGLAEVKHLFVERLLEHEVFQVPNGREGAENMTTSRKENMLATLALLQREYGGAERYLLDFVGLPAADLAVLRQKLTEPAVSANL